MIYLKKIIASDKHNSQIWQLLSDEWAVSTDDRAIAKRLKGIKKVKAWHPHVDGFCRVFCFKTPELTQICKLVDLPLDKCLIGDRSANV